MNDNADIPNPALRSHVTEHSFVLTMRKMHIAAMTCLAHADRTYLDFRKMFGRDDWVGAVRGLERRGLVQHRINPDFTGKNTSMGPITNYYRLTRAGWSVFDLLVEAGMADAVGHKSAKRKLVA